MENNSTYYENDINKLNIVNQEATRSVYVGDNSYSININVEVYENTLEIYKKVLDGLKLNKKFAKSNMITGELKTYYDSLNQGNDIEKIIDDLILEFEDIILKIETSLNVYEEIDTEMLGFLNSIIGEVFTTDTTNLELKDKSLEERRAYLSETINKIERVLSELMDQYEEVYGEGIKVSEESAVCFVNLLTALGAFQMYGTNGSVEDVTNNFVNSYELYNEDTGCFNIEQLGFVLDYCKQTGIIPAIKNYVEGDSWGDSGLDSLVGDSLKQSVAGTQAGFQWEQLDAESIFIHHYVSIYCQGEYNDFVSDLTELTKDLDSSYGVDGYDITGGEFALYHGIGYDPNSIWFEKIGNKDYAVDVIKAHIKGNDVFMMYENLEPTYEDAITKRSDILNLQNTLYNYKQYYNLMPFEVDKKNTIYLSNYLTKNYDESYQNEVLPKDWLQYLDKSELALVDYLYNEKSKDEAREYINAMCDIVNQRKGYSGAIGFVESLDKDYVFDDVVDTIISVDEGLSDGLINFGDGFHDFLYADGTRSAKDYELIYKMQLLSGDNEYTTNLSEDEKKWLSGVYQFGNSIGYMAIPTLLSYVPVVGSALSFGALTISSSGNSTEDLMQQGVDKERAYMYGTLMGLSESVVEKLIGGLPGSPDNAGKGVLELVKSSLGEAGEEAFQTYISTGISSMATGEPIDFVATTNEAYEAGLMAIFTSGAMNTGGSVFIKTANKIIETSPSKYNNYKEWRASIENDFRKNNSDVANILMGKSTESTKLILDIGKEELNNIDSKQKEMISNLTYDTKTGEYQVTLINGNTFNVDNLDKVNSNVLISNLTNEKPSTEGLVKKMKDFLTKKNSDVDTQPVSQTQSESSNTTSEIQNAVIIETPENITETQAETVKPTLEKDAINRQDISSIAFEEEVIPSTADSVIIESTADITENQDVTIDTVTTNVGFNATTVDGEISQIIQEVDVVGDKKTFDFSTSLIEHMNNSIKNGNNVVTLSDGTIAPISFDCKYSEIQGPNERGKYEIFGDQMNTTLNIGDTPVVNYSVMFRRRTEDSPNYSEVEIEYYNNFYNTNDSNYLNKGYAKYGLQKIVEALLEKNVTPEINLSINNDNVASIKVATDSGFVKTSENSYSSSYTIFHPNAVKLYENAIQPLKNSENTELYDKLLDNFKKRYNEFKQITFDSDATTDNVIIESTVNVTETQSETQDTVVESMNTNQIDVETTLVTTIESHLKNDVVKEPVSDNIMKENSNEFIVESNGYQLKLNIDLKNVEGKYQYFDNYYEDFGLPPGYTAQDFFDSSLLDYIINKSFFCKFSADDVKELLKNDGHFTQQQEKVLQIIGTKDIQTRGLAKAVASVLQTEIAKNEFVNFVLNNSAFKTRNLMNILKNDSFLFELFCQSDLSPNFCNNMLDFYYWNMDKSGFLKILGYENFKTVFYNSNVLDFFDRIEGLDLGNELSEIINTKLSSLSYNEAIELLQRKYNKGTESPQYLKSLYDVYQEDLIRLEIRDSLSLVIINPSSDNIEKANEVLKSEFGKEVLLTNFLEPGFSKIINVLNLDESLKIERKKALETILNNYSQYSVDTVKSVLLALYFESSTHDVILNLKTILEYANQEAKAMELISDEYNQLVALYNFLNSEIINVNPNTVISEAIDLEKIISDLNELFKEELHEKIKLDVTELNVEKTILQTATGKEVEVYSLDDFSSDKYKFLIHSTDVNNVESFQNQYLASAQEHGKICMSLLGDGRYRIFSKSGIIFGYSDINQLQLYSATVNDGQTNQRASDVRQYRSNLLPIDSFLNLTNPNSYNEIAFLTQNETVLPNYILSFNEVPTSQELEVASQFGIPIYTLTNIETKQVESFEGIKLEEYDYATTIDIQQSGSVDTKDVIDQSTWKAKENDYIDVISLDNMIFDYEFVQPEPPSIDRNLIINDYATTIDIQQSGSVDTKNVIDQTTWKVNENNHVDVLDVPSLDDMIFDYEFVQPEQPFIDRNLVINEYSKSEFMDFLENDNSGQILKILDEAGIKILNESQIKEDRIRYILTYSKYKNELLSNGEFLDIFLNTNISDYYAVLSDLNFETYDKILERCIEGNFENYTFVELFNFFDVNYQLKALENWKYSNELIYDIFKKFNIPVVKKILENYNIDLLSHDINIERLFEIARESVFKAQQKRYEHGEIVDEITIPVNMITDELASELWNKYDIFRLRKIVNDANYCTDPSVLNEYIKRQEEKIISENKMINQVLKLFYAFKKVENLTYGDSNRWEVYKNYEGLLNSMNMLYEEQILERIYATGGIYKVKEYLQKLRDRMLSNYIIDYHFEENFHNIMIDVRELLKFYNDGNIYLSQEKVDLYQKIASIDSLSILEKVELHKQLKSVDIKDLFYDDMSLAREIVGEAIRDYSLTYESLKQYRNEQLSNQYGIDVYTIEDNPFFAVVKTGRRAQDLLPTGHSYSLIGYGGITIFGSVENSETYLYDSSDLKSKQVVHTFPFDSFSFYRPFTVKEKASNNVNVLMMPEELMANTRFYNELVILERGSSLTEMDENIPELKRMALYCIDEITDVNVKVAKSSGVGIFLVNSKKYHKPDNIIANLYRRDIYLFDYTYFDGVNRKQKFEDNR